MHGYPMVCISLLQYLNIFSVKVFFSSIPFFESQAVTDVPLLVIDHFKKLLAFLWLFCFHPVYQVFP